MMKINKKFVIIAIFLAAAIFAALRGGLPALYRLSGSGPTEQGDEILARAFQERAGGIHVEGAGTVSRILPDDNDGSRHQRFIIRLGTGQTLLIAHNIDLAERIGTLETGDRVKFSGEYEWNPEGGVIHWTHRDPSGRRSPGWIEHEDRKYW